MAQHLKIGGRELGEGVVEGGIHSGRPKFIELCAPHRLLSLKRPCAVALVPCFQLSENYAKARTTRGCVCACETVTALHVCVYVCSSMNID